MPSATTLVTVLAGLVAVLAAAIYLFGIPPALKRAMEEKALDTLGENKASYLMKGDAGFVYCLYTQLTPLRRPNQQDSRIRPERREPTKKKRRKCRWWPFAESSRKAGWKCKLIALHTFGRMIIY